MRLTECVKSGDFDLVKSYLDEIKSTDRDELALALLLSTSGKSTLFENSEPEDTRIIELLLQHGAEPNDILNNKLSPLLAAIEYYQPEKVKLLIYFGADVNLPDKDGNLPLKYAVGSEYEFSDQMCEPIKMDITIILFEAGADPNLKDSDDQSALEYAVELGYESAIELFKKK
ncbi:ankyrin repeat domain-containing protein [Gimesia sp.]|uniref:ankyrin repeat domain-containing protein n=1 Tax=Gimesia sp. TaxID=2024833 RepID=UPI003A90EDE7